MTFLRQIIAYMCMPLLFAACNNDIFIDTFDIPAEDSYSIPGSGGECSFLLPADNMTMAIYVESGDYDIDATLPGGEHMTNCNWLEGDGRFTVSPPRVDMTVERTGRRVEVKVSRYYSKRDESVEIVFSTEYQSFTDTIKIPAYNPYELRGVEYQFQSTTLYDDMGSSSTIFNGSISNHSDSPMKFPFILSEATIPVFYKCRVEGSGEMYFDMVKGAEFPIPSSLTDDPWMWSWGLLGDSADLASEGAALLTHYPPLPSIDSIPPHTTSQIRLASDNELMQFVAILDIYNAHTSQSHQVYMWLSIDIPFDYTVSRNDIPLE